jgi:hypothetical protein
VVQALFATFRPAERVSRGATVELPENLLLGLLHHLVVELQAPGVERPEIRWVQGTVARECWVQAGSDLVVH